MYTIPTYIHAPESFKLDSIPLYRLYEVLLEDAEALAVFNHNNYCIVVIRPNLVYMLPPQRVVTRAFNDQYTTFKIDPPIAVPNYRHIGYIRTVQECKNVMQLPYFLLQDVDTKEVPDIQSSVCDNPLVDPKLPLYKILIETDHKAVYYDLDTMKPVFVD